MRSKKLWSYRKYDMAGNLMKDKKEDDRHLFSKDLLLKITI